jgi:type I restriction enzyme R subunit
VDLPGPIEKRFDIVFVANGLPLVIGEAKSPARSAVTWFDGAYRVSEIYEKQVPAIFVPNVFSFATEGRVYRYGSIRMPIDLWGPWRTEENEPEGTLADVSRSVESMLQPEVVLDLLQYYTLFATDKKHRRIKIIARYQQFVTANQIVDRVVRGYPKKGLIWHFQGSGKSLLMVFAAQKLRLHPGLGNPTVMIVVDRIDLDTQITATFNAADVPNMVSVATRQELQTLLAQDVRKVLITIIHKFAEADGDLNERSNIIVLVDEAHRTQEGDLGRKMREALPNAFLFGLTGTPINRADRNTFWAFGADEDEKGYMSRYSFQESIRDRATLPLHFETPEVKLQIDRAAIDEAYQAMYLDKPMKDHNLLQAICRTNRTFGQKKTHGLIVDYIGIFDDVAHALDFDEKTVQQVITNIDDLRRELPIRVQKCLTFFPGVDRTRGGYEGLMEAQQCLPDNEARDGFAAEYSVLGTIWEALSPDPVLGPYENDFR